MTQTIANLGEIGRTGATLRPLDLPILRAGNTWDLTGYSNPRIETWDQRTRTAIAAPGSVTIQDEATGTIRWSPAAANLPSGAYEARFIVQRPDGEDEPSGLFRYSIGAAPT